MYLHKCTLENVGPIDSLSVEMPFHPDSKPKPVVIVGKNGTGKSILLSYIVNYLVVAKDKTFETKEISDDKVFKIRSPSYIKVGKNYYYAKLEFSGSITYTEVFLDRNKEEFEKQFQNSPILAKPEWNNIEKNNNDRFDLPGSGNKFEIQKENIYSSAILYFPPNRFLDPAWLNLENLNLAARLSSVSKIVGITSRKIIKLGDFQEIVNWILDVAFDSRVLDPKTLPVPQYLVKALLATQDAPQPGQELERFQFINALLSGNLWAGYEGKSTAILNQINIILKNILEFDMPIRIGIDPRNSRRVAIMLDSKNANSLLVPNIANISTGQSQLLYIFLSILYDFDKSTSALNSLEDIKGMVIIDEVDLHLHSDLLYKVLPELISLFPNVQFILTAHSPLFLLGMENTFGADGFSILEMPEGNWISTERYSEFLQSYKYFSNTKTHEDSVNSLIRESTKPILFVEGKLDVEYLRKAAEVLGKSKLLDEIDIHPIGKEGRNGDEHGGSAGLTGAYNFISSNLPTLKNKIILLYDSDTNKEMKSEGLLFVRTIQKNEENSKFENGIENLFPQRLFTKRFDREKKRPNKKGGEHIDREVDKNAFCNYMCNELTVSLRTQRKYFKKFLHIFEMLEKILSE